MDPKDLPEEIRDALEQRMKDNPELVEKYGNPLDPNDPRFWAPTEREARGVSIEDRLRYLENDVEQQLKLVADLVIWKLEEQRRRVLERVEAAKKDPQLAMELLNEIMGGNNAPAMTDNDGNALAGSIRDLPADALISTPDGVIRKDQIPGYRDVPGWMPSPDWIDSNCMCPVHQQQRALNQRTSQKYDLPGDGPTGFYL